MAKVFLAEPMRVSEEIIARCRELVESPLKRKIRAALVPLIRQKYGFVELGEGFQWGFPLGIPQGRVRVGRFAYLGAHGSMIGPVVIGDLTMLSTHVKFVGNDHRIDVPGSPARLEFEKQRPTTVIEADCWIGLGVTIREGVRIGRGAVIGAGAVVAHSVPPYSIAAGVPAKIVRMRFDAGQIEQHDARLYGGRPSQEQVQIGL